jgi:hypothetical protein
VVDERPAVAADMVGIGPVKSWADAEKGMRDSKVCASAEHDNCDLSQPCGLLPSLS